MKKGFLNKLPQLHRKMQTVEHFSRGKGDLMKVGSRGTAFRFRLPQQMDRLTIHLRTAAFSLVELMISLIVISIITAAFAPIISKKIKSADLSLSSNVEYNYDEAFCSSITQNCSVCTGSSCKKCCMGEV